MHPVICRIGVFTVYSYGLALAAAFMLASVLASRRAHQIGLRPESVFNFCFLVFVAGIIGARLFYVGHHFLYYFKNPLEIVMLQQGGLSWFGGLIAGTACGLLYLRKKKLPVGKIADLLAPYLALAQAIGRIGCFLNGCCFGRDSIPTQLYSSFFLMVIFSSCDISAPRPHRDGEIFLVYLLLYCAKRFTIEFFRADNPPLIFGLTIFHILSFAGMLIAVGGLAALRKTKSK